MRTWVSSVVATTRAGWLITSPIPVNRLHVIPDELDYRAAALIEPLSTPVHAVRIAGDIRDKAVVILGAGTIGLLVLAVVRAHGVRRVVVTDPLPAKRALAEQLGADVVLDAADDIVAQARAALGVNQALLFTGALFLGAFLAGLGGALQVPKAPATARMDLDIIAEAFVVTVVGGMGSIPGAFLASLIIGQLQGFGILIFPKITLVLVFLLMA